MGTKLPTVDVIKYCAYETATNGYIKRSDKSDEYCTADRVLDDITKDLVDDADLESVKDRIVGWSEYVASQEGDYFNNVKSEMSKLSIDEMKIGLIASSFASFDKYQLIGKQREIDKQSEYLGEEGDSVTVVIKDHKLIKSGMSKFGNGTSSKWWLYSIHDNFGNVITYFSNSDCEFEFKHCHKIKATISKLSEYNGVKQTGVSKLTWLDED